MITTRKELKEYLESDAKAFGFKDSFIRRLRQYLVDPMHWQLPNWMVVKELRLSEYYFNNRKKSLLCYFMSIIYANYRGGH